MRSTLSLRIRILLVPGFIAFSAGACAYRHEKGDAGIDGAHAARQSSSFAQVREQVFAPKCTSCHQHQSEFIDYGRTFSQRDDIRQKVFVEHSMPKGDTLSSAQSTMLQQWLDAGAPEQAQQPAGSGSPATPVPGEAIPPTWANVQKRFFVPHCTQCHSGDTPKGDLDLTDVLEIRPLSAKIMDRVFFNTVKPMPPTQAAHDAMTADEKVLLINWIAARMPGADGTTPVPIPSPIPTPAPDPTGAVAAAIVTITQNFDTKIMPLMKRSCTACHDSHARPEGFLGHIPGIRQREWNHIRNASKVLDFSRMFPSWSTQSSNPVFFLDQIRAVIQKGIMPTWDFKLAHHLDGRLLRPYERQAVIDWTVDSEKLLAQADSSHPTAAKILQNRCLGCHNIGTHSGGLAFEASETQLKVLQGTSSGGIPYFTAGVPENSAIFLVLLTDSAARKGLSPMPRNSDPLSDQERDLVHDWIKQLH